MSGHGEGLDCFNTRLFQPRDIGIRNTFLRQLLYLLDLVLELSLVCCDGLRVYLLCSSLSRSGTARLSLSLNRLFLF